jgi:hypothetical protein
MSSIFFKLDKVKTAHMQILSTNNRPLKGFIVYGVAVVVILIGCALLPLIHFTYADALYYLATAVALGAGIVHLKSLNRIFNVGAAGTFGICLVLSLAPVVISTALSSILYYLLPAPFQFLTFQFAFIIPFLVYQAHTAFLEIPVGKYKTWSYPYFDQSPKTDDIDHSVTQVVNLVLSKEADSSVQTSFKLDAPVNLPFGSLFFNFINEYNKAHTDKEIVYADENSKRYGWSFYRKNGWLMQKEFIDPEATFLENGIKKDETIYAARDNAANKETVDFETAETSSPTAF